MKLCYETITKLHRRGHRNYMLRNKITLRQIARTLGVIYLYLKLNLYSVPSYLSSYTNNFLHVNDTSNSCLSHEKWGIR